jgi:hypothetical protein
MTKRLTTLFVTACLAAAVSGCQSGGAGSLTGQSAGTAPPAGSQEQTATLERQYSQCMREHGVPNFPDPIISDGNVSYGQDDSIKSNPHLAEASEACKSIQERISSQPGGKNWNPTAADRQKLAAFAKCVREHGVPEWPDANADGSFTLTPKLEDEDPQTRINPAQTACRGYWDGPINSHGNKK